MVLALSMTEARAFAQDLIDGLSLKTYELQYETIASAYNPKREDIDPEEIAFEGSDDQCYVFYYTPSYNGVRSSFGHKPAVGQTTDKTYDYREAWEMEKPDCYGE